MTLITRIPNQEVRVALGNQLIEADTAHPPSQRTGWQRSLSEPLCRGDVDARCS